MFFLPSAKSSLPPFLLTDLSDAPGPVSVLPAGLEAFPTQSIFRQIVPCIQYFTVANERSYQFFLYTPQSKIQSFVQEVPFPSQTQALPFLLIATCWLLPPPSAGLYQPANLFCPPLSGLYQATLTYLTQ